MALKLNKECLFAVCVHVKNYLKNGSTLERFLTDFSFSKRQWDKYVSKNKKLQYAIEDGLIYYKAFWQDSLNADMLNKNTNSALTKLAYENALGWSESARKRNAGEKTRKRFKLVLDLGPEDESNIDVEIKKLLDRTKEKEK